MGTGGVVIGSIAGLTGGKPPVAFKFRRAESLSDLLKFARLTEGEPQCIACVSGEELPSDWISRPEGE